MHLHLQHRPPRVPRANILPSPRPHVAQFVRLVDAFEREDIEASVDLLIAALDARDGDPDLEPNGDEMDASYPEANVARAAVIKGRAIGHEDAEEDDEAEDDGDTADGDGSEDDFMQHADDRGAGCPLADPGGHDTVDAPPGETGHQSGRHEDEEPCNIALLRRHRDRIRSTRCGRVDRHGWTDWNLPYRPATRCLIGGIVMVSL